MGFVIFLRRSLHQNYLKLHFVAKHNYHTTTILNRRRGAVSDVALPEQIANKPPNYYPNIQQKLDRINYFDNPKNPINIGYGEESVCYQNFLKAAHQINGEKSKYSEKFENVLDLDNKNANENLSESDCKNIFNLSMFTKDYIESTISLAHHYAIFRDLFFKKPVQLKSCDELISLNAKYEVKSNPNIIPESYYFIPLVPINVEFILEVDQDILCQKSCRGNIIPPEYGVQPPNIVINSSSICGKLDAEIDSNEFGVVLKSGESKETDFFTVALVNLDSHFNDSGVCHWLLSNIHNVDGQTKFETFIKYLPIYGIRGLGYHRYAFILFKHNEKLQNIEKIENYDLGKRKFNALNFIEEASLKNINIKPIGMSWFQTTWNQNCDDIFYKYLDMRSPTYEYIYPKQSTEFKQVQFPGRAPFNLYLDSFRDPKELSKSVLVERLKSVDPYTSYNPEKLYPTWDGVPKFPHIHPFPKDTPDWIKSTLLKKRSLTGRFRGLRPASSILPYNNNADLDNPKWPRISADVKPINCPNPYPDGKRRPKPLKTTLWSKPLPEHHSYRLDHPESLTDKDKKNYEKKSLE